MFPETIHLKIYHQWKKVNSASLQSLKVESYNAAGLKKKPEGNKEILKKRLIYNSLYFKFLNSFLKHSKYQIKNRNKTSKRQMSAIYIEIYQSYTYNKYEMNWHVKIPLIQIINVLMDPTIELCS